MSDNEPQAQFERLVMPHLDAAYNLARWLAGNDHDAEDIAQEAFLRAFRFVGGCRAQDGRSWLFAIVRNTAYSWLKKNRTRSLVPIDDEELTELEDPSGTSASLHCGDTDALHTALEALPHEFRESIVLRELEGLSYKEIAEIAKVPVGTVMSRLARARRQLQRALNREVEA